MSFLNAEVALPSRFLKDTTNGRKIRSVSTPLSALERNRPAEDTPLFFKTPPDFSITPKPLNADDLATTIVFMENNSRDIVIWDSDVGSSTLIHLPLTIFLSPLDSRTTYVKPPKVSITRLEVALAPRPKKPATHRGLIGLSRGTGTIRPRPTPAPSGLGLYFNLRHSTDLHDVPAPLQDDPQELSGFKDVPDGIIETSWHRYVERDTNRRRKRWSLRVIISVPISIFRNVDTRALKFGVAVCVHDEDDMRDWVTGEEILTVTLLKTSRELTPCAGS